MKQNLNDFCNSSLLSNLFDDNKFIGVEPEIINSNITFNGKNNILYCEKDVVIKNSNIIFNGNNSLILLKKGLYCFCANIYTDSVLYVGEDNYFNPHGTLLNIIVSEHQNTFIGNNNLFSTGISIRTADPHLIYDINSKIRINNSKSCYIGNHVWVGQNVIILKGTNIHSGSIIGAGSVIANKELQSNSVFAGNPVKLLKKEVFWDNKCTHGWDKTETDKFSSISEDKFVYKYDKNIFIPFNSLDFNLNNLPFADNKLEYLKNLPNDKNIFTYLK